MPPTTAALATLASLLLAAAHAAPTSPPTDHGVPVQQWYMNTADGVVHYVAEHGVAARPENVAVVLHGGWGAEHGYLLPAVRPLAHEHRFVLYDQRGSLRSPVKPPATISFPQLVEDLEQLRQRLGLERMTLVAHSMGNHLAYGYLAAHPDRVERLILVGPVTPAPFGEQRPAFLADAWPEFGDADVQAAAARTADYERDVFRRVIRIAADEGIIPPEARDATPENVQDFRLKERLDTDQLRTQWWRIQFTCVNTFDGSNWREMAGGQIFYNPDVAAAVLPDPAYADAIARFWPALRAYRGPVHVIIGTNDHVDLGPTMWPRLVPALPNAALHVIQDAGHSIWMDEPDALTNALRAALASPPAPAP